MTFHWENHRCPRCKKLGHPLMNCPVEDHMIESGMGNFDYSQLNPGVRELVKELREKHGFNTTDSGDGTNLANGMEGAMEERHVYIQVSRESFFEEGERLQALYPDGYIEASWWPGSGTYMLLFFPDGLKVPEGYTTVDPKLS